jgi:uncharacterized protein (TIGR00369 family)
VTQQFDVRLYDQVCFACGNRNPHGLHLRFEPDRGVEGGGVLARYAPKAEDQGFPGVLHGGILVTLLDEAMAWAMWASDGALGVTAKMETRYRRPATLEDTLTVHGRVVRARGRRIEVESRVEDATGDTVAEASALFLRLPPAEEARVAAALGWDRIPR